MRLVRGAGGVRVLTPEEDTALRRAREIIAAAESTAESIRQGARTEGRAEAHAEATALRVRAAAVEVLDDAQRTEAVVTLACEVAATILGREAALGTDVVRDVTVRVLARARRAQGAILRVHPEEAEAVRGRVASWRPEGALPVVLAVEADPTVPRGGVIAMTDIGQLDGRLEVQLDALARALAVESPKR